jgi:hypothetical protein
MSLHYSKTEKGTTWSGTLHLPTFYVHAVDGEHAKGMALAVANPDARFGMTSGSAIAMIGSEDEIVSNLNPDESTYYSWSDL